MRAKLSPLSVLKDSVPVSHRVCDVCCVVWRECEYRVSLYTENSRFGRAWGGGQTA